MSPEAHLDLTAKLRFLVEACQSNEPKLSSLRAHAEQLRMRAAQSVSVLHASCEPVPQSVAHLLELDLDKICSVPGPRSLPSMLEDWEAGVHALELMIADIKSIQQARIAACRDQLKDLEVERSSTLLKLVGVSDLWSKADADLVCICLLSPDAGTEGACRAHEVGFVSCLNSAFEVVSKIHVRMTAVSNLAERFLETWFVAVLQRCLRDANCQEHVARFSRNKVGALVEQVHTCLLKSRGAIDAGISQAQELWKNAPRFRTDFPPASVREQTLSLLDAATRIRTDDCPPPPEWLERLEQELNESSRDMATLEVRLAAVTESLNILTERDRLRDHIIELDRKLETLVGASTAFEMSTKDSNRLQDRSGKGHKDLLSEEHQRKVFQRSTKELMTELRKALLQWESAEKEKFDADQLSERGLELRNAKTDAAITGKTQLMHLESSIQIGSVRRNSGERVEVPELTATESKHMEEAEVAPPRTCSKSKTNPFARMTVRKSIAFAPSNRLSADSGEGFITEDSSKGQENLDPSD